MKMYEGASKVKLTRRMPMIIRIDGKAFHRDGFRRDGAASLCCVLCASSFEWHGCCTSASTRDVANYQTPKGPTHARHSRADGRR